MILTLLSRIHTFSLPNIKTCTRVIHMDCANIAKSNNYVKCNAPKETITNLTNGTNENCASIVPLPDRKLVEDLLKRRFFIAQSFELYGGVNGLFDFGPIGCSTKANFLTEWRNHFVIRDGMLEVETSILTPENVLKASGHVDRFCDYMVKDIVTGDCYRVDHLIKDNLSKLKMEATKLENILATLDNLDATELANLISEYNIKSPSGNELDKPQEFNLMFSTTMGATSLHRCYMRPETAQGIFVNFKRLLAFNQGKLPFAAAQIGSAFRNEIAPRAGLLRVREFCMAEIEHFVDPEKKHVHPYFQHVANIEINIWAAKSQMSGETTLKITTIDDAVKNKIINNQHLGYFMGRIYQFLMKCGIAKDKFRFRQHLPNEMAHYACDCWDAECLTTYGWIECVGCADRSCYDLKQHTKATGHSLVAERILDSPKSVENYKLKLNRKEIGKYFKEKAAKVTNALSNLSESKFDALTELKTSGKDSFTINIEDEETEILFDMITFNKETRTIDREEFVPSVIEPSFGVGRVLYSIWEHSFRIRESDTQRTYLALPSCIAPYKCAVLPLSGDQRLLELCETISQLLRDSLISHKVERSSSVSIGKRYARTDEIGVPFCITVDFDSVNVNPISVTLRERDFMNQIRVKLDKIPELVNKLCCNQISWKSAVSQFGAFVEQKTI